VEPDRAALVPELERLDLCPDRQTRQHVPEFMRDRTSRYREQERQKQLPGLGRPGDPPYANASPPNAPSQMSAAIVRPTM
jgi:hypothetical protein